LIAEQLFGSAVFDAGTIGTGQSFRSPVLSTTDIAIPIRRQQMAKHAKDLKDLFHGTLKDIYFAEKQILRALPKMAKAAQSDDAGVRNSSRRN
jgi:uncharacterized protein DUF892